MEWLHFVGKGYYTIPGFEKEALSMGASRKTSLTMLSAFNWGHRIWLTQGDMKKKTRRTPVKGSIVFGSFRLERLGGLNLEVIEYLKSQGIQLTETDEPTGVQVHRGCGDYVTGSSYTVDPMFVTLGEIGTLLRDFEGEVGELLLQGPYTPLEPKVLLPEVTFRWGFRRFHGPNFMTAQRRAADKNPGENPVKVFGDFKNVDSLKPLAEPKNPVLQTVESYHQGRLYATLKDQEI